MKVLSKGLELDRDLGTYDGKCCVRMLIILPVGLLMNIGRDVGDKAWFIDGTIGG